MQYIQQPRAIEAKSFDIIGEIIRETRPTISLPVRYMKPLSSGSFTRRRISTGWTFCGFPVMCWSSFVPRLAVRA